MFERRQLLTGLAAVSTGSAVQTQSATGPSTSSALGAALAGAVGDLRSFGARTDGVADDSAALVGAASAGAVIFPKGVTRIGRDVEIAAYAIATSGARLRVDAGTTVTFARGFWASLDWVFEGPGMVRFAPGTLHVGHPEWWGARPGDPAIDCEPAINACLEACPVTQLQQAAYHVRASVRMTRSGRSLIGVNDSQTLTAPCSEIVIHDRSRPALVCGRESRSSAPMTDYLTIANFTVSRAGAPLDSPDLGAAAAGVRMMWCALVHAERVTARDQPVGFYLYACVESYFVQCSAMAMTAPAEGSHACGFFLDYTAALGMAGGNASLYFERCRAFAKDHARMGYSAGLASDGGFVDLYISRFETGFQQFGIDLRGDGVGSASFATQDCQIADCVLDSNAMAGIRVRAGGRHADVHIRGCYIALPGPVGSSAALRLGGDAVADGVAGAVTAIGCEFIGEFCGVAATNVAVCNLAMNTHLSIAEPVRFKSVRNSEIRDIVHVPDRRRVVGPVVRLNHCDGISVAVSVTGAAESFEGGIEMTDDSSRVAIDRTRIDDTVIGGVQKLVLFEGKPWGGAAAFGHHNVVLGAGPLKSGGL